MSETKCIAALDCFWSMVEMTGTRTGRNWTGTGKTYYWLALYGSQSFTVCPQSFLSGNYLKISNKTVTNGT